MQTQLQLHESLNILSFTENQIKQWLNYADIKATSERTYTRAIKQYVAYLVDQGITEPTRQDILNYKQSLIAKGLASTTIASYIQAVKSLYNFVSAEYSAKNIAQGIKAPNIASGFRKDYLTADQVQELLQSIDQSTTKGLRDFVIIYLMIQSGLRTNEIVNINVEDITNKNGKTIIYILGKGYMNKESFITISAETEQLLRYYLKKQNITDPKAPLFCSISNHNNSNRLTTKSLSRIVKDRFKAIGFNSSRLTAHSLRATTCTLLYFNGATLEQVSRTLRHKSINTTRIYLHDIEKEQDNSAEILTNLFKNNLNNNFYTTFEEKGI